MEQKTVREKVAQILTDIEKDDTYLQLALKKELDTLEAKDKGFANELIYGTIKWRLRLDYVLDQFSKTPVKNETFYTTTHAYECLSNFVFRQSTNIGSD